MKSLLITTILCTLYVLTCADTVSDLQALREKFAGLTSSTDVKDVAEKFADAKGLFNEETKPKISSALSNFLTKVNSGPAANTARSLTVQNQARHHSPSYPSPYGAPSPYGYPSQTGYPSSQYPYNPYNQYSAPKYYQDPNGKLYNVLPDGSLYDPLTRQTYAVNAQGERIIPGTTGFGTYFVVAADGSAYTEVNGVRYKVDDQVSPDGKRYYTDTTTGARFYVDQSGNRVAVGANGITYTQQPDGTIFYTGTNGVTYYQDPTNLDTYTKDAAGNTYRIRQDGTSYIKAANGCTYNVSATGTTTLTSTTNTNCPATFTGTSPEGVVFSG